MTAAWSVAVLALLAEPQPAAAHGPCRCTWPAVIEPGGTVRTASGYKAIWNPRPRNFANQTTPVGLASGQRADAPTVTIVQGTPGRPRRRMRVRVPQATPPGIYLVLVYDGSEAGAHATWDYVQVPGRPATTALTDRTSADLTAPPSRTRTLALALLAAGLLVAIGARHARRAGQER